MGWMFGLGNGRLCFFPLELWAEAGLSSILRVNILVYVVTFHLFSFLSLSVSLSYRMLFLTTPAVSLSFFP